MSDDPQAFHFSLDSVPLPVKLAPRPKPPVPLPTMIVCASWHHRNRMIAEMKGSPNALLFKIVTIGEALAGFRVGDILVTREARQLALYNPSKAEWLELDAPLRIQPGYRMINL
jgi:hypothetical protein